MKIQADAVSFLRRRPWAVALTLLVAVPFLTTVVVDAAVPDANNTITACYKTYTGKIRIIDTEVTKVCGAAEQKLTWASGPDTGWTAPTLLNGWVDYPSPWSPVGYRKIGGVVWLRGLVSNGTLDTAMFTLPAGSRPGIRLLFNVQTWPDVSARMEVHADGTVINGSGSGNNAWISLDGISFPTDG